MSDTNGSGEGSRDEQKSSGTRRKFLKQASAFGGAITASKLGISKVRASPTERADDEAVRAALEDPKVQSILDDLGSPKVLERRAAVQTKSIEDVSIDITVVPTVAGDIKYGVKNDGSTEAQFRFEDVRSRGQLPERYRSLPNAESAMLKGLDDRAVLARQATEREKSTMVEDLGIDSEKVVAFTSSETNTFTLKYLGADDAVHTYEVGGAEVYTEADVGGFTYEEVTSNSDDVSAAVDCSKDWCWRCAMSTGACGGCMMACSTVGPGCVLCLTSTCGASGYSCTACLDCA